MRRCQAKIGGVRANAYRIPTDKPEADGTFAMIRRVLSQDLMQLLPSGSVVLPMEPAPPGTRKIVLDVLEFAPDAAGTVQFEGTWSLTAPGTAELLESRSFRLSASSAANDFPGQVKSMSGVLGRLATSMAEALSGR